MTVILAGNTVIAALDESLSTHLTMFTCSIVVTVVTLTNASMTRAVAMTLTPRVTRVPSPAQVTLTLVVWVPGTLAMLTTARMTRLTAGLSPIPLISLLTFTRVRLGSVDTDGIGMTIVQIQVTLVNIRTREVLPRVIMTRVLCRTDSIAPATALLLVTIVTREVTRTWTTRL